MKIILDKFALIISAIASPFLVVPAFSVLIINRYSENLSQKLLLSFLFLLFSAFIPLFFILYEVKKGAISDVHVTLREQRTKPFLVSIFGTLLVLFSFLLAGAPNQLISMAYVLLANGIVFALITQFWKISIHSAALSGSITLAVFLLDINFAFMYLTLPLVAWARMHRHRHNFWQTLMAAIITPFITLVILKIILSS